MKQDGKLTAWCAQHDEKTLAPAWARAYEPPSLSGSESVGIVRFLMEIEKPTPEIVAAIEGAVAWFRAVAIPGLRQEDFTGADGQEGPARRCRILPPRRCGRASTSSAPTVRSSWVATPSSATRYSEIEHERRNGYAYYGRWPASLLDVDYPNWREKNAR